MTQFIASGMDASGKIVRVQIEARDAEAAKRKAEAQGIRFVMVYDVPPDPLAAPSAEQPTAAPAKP